MNEQYALLGIQSALTKEKIEAIMAKFDGCYHSLHETQLISPEPEKREQFIAELIAVSEKIEKANALGAKGEIELDEDMALYFPIANIFLNVSDKELSALEGFDVALYAEVATSISSLTSNISLDSPPEKEANKRTVIFRQVAGSVQAQNGEVVEAPSAVLLSKLQSRNIGQRLITFLNNRATNSAKTFKTLSKTGPLAGKYRWEVMGQGVNTSSMFTDNIVNETKKGLKKMGGDAFKESVKEGCKEGAKVIPPIVVGLSFLLLLSERFVLATQIDDTDTKIMLAKTAMAIEEAKSQGSEHYTSKEVKIDEELEALALKKEQLQASRKYIEANLAICVVATVLGTAAIIGTAGAAAPIVLGVAVGGASLAFTGHEQAAASQRKSKHRQIRKKLNAAQTLTTLLGGNILKRKANESSKVYKNRLFAEVLTTYSKQKEESHEMVNDKEEAFKSTEVATSFNSPRGVESVDNIFPSRATPSQKEAAQLIEEPGFMEWAYQLFNTEQEKVSLYRPAAVDDFERIESNVKQLEEVKEKGVNRNDLIDWFDSFFNTDEKMIKEHESVNEDVLEATEPVTIEWFKALLSKVLNNEEITTPALPAVNHFTSTP